MKNKVWQYPYSSHLEWFKNNIKSDDIHLLLWDEDNLIGYMNLVNVRGSVDSLGIGNVVISPDRQGQNLGLLLMYLCDYYLSIVKLPGILICKDKVLGFYKRCGWEIFERDTFMNGDKIPFNILTRRFDTSKFHNLQIDRLF